MNTTKDMTQTVVGPREVPGRKPYERFMVGKYEVVAKPVPNSAHLLQYTVFLRGARIGATVSVPTESDCRFLEKPPPVPPVKPFQAFYRPGRPKKGAQPAASGEKNRGLLPQEDLPADIPLPALDQAQDR